MTDEHEQLAYRLRQAAGDFPYPPTPPLRYRPASARRPAATWRRVILLAGIALISLMLIDPIRAAVLERLQMGAIMISIGEVSPVTPQPDSLIDLAGEVSMEDAIQTLGFTPRLPAEFGPPDAVYVQDGDGTVLILVWLAEDDPETIALSLYQLPYHDVPAYGKLVGMAHNTRVNGQAALWLDVPHILVYRAGEGT